MGFPTNCLRGLAKGKWVIDGLVSAAAFEPDNRTIKTRADRLAEISINWEDDGRAFEALAESKEALHGVARLSLQDIEYVRKKAPRLNVLQYERDKIDGNDYHGNLLLDGDMPPALRTMLMNSLALHARLATGPIEDAQT